MAKYIVDESELISIADSIRDKKQSTESLTFPQDFIDKVDSISVDDVALKKVSGTVLDIPDAAGGIYIKSLSVDIKPTQEGTGDPSSSNIRPFVPVYDINVIHTGQNLLPNLLENEINGITLTVDAQGYILNGTATKDTYFDTTVDYVIPKNTIYKLMALNPVAGDSRLTLFLVNDSNGSIPNAQVNLNTINAIFTSVAQTKNVHITKIRLRVPANTEYNNFRFAPMQIINTDEIPTAFSYYESENKQISINKGGAIFEGKYDFNSGILTITYDYIESYNNEVLPGEWISDRDTYTVGGQPTVGAQVVYKLTEPVDIQKNTALTTMYNIDHNVFISQEGYNLNAEYYTYEVNPILNLIPSTGGGTE